MESGDQSEEFVLHDSKNFEDFYELHEVLGSGKFGTVYRCKKKKDGGVWAAKIIKTIRSKERAAVKKELEIMGCLKHSTLLRCMEAYQTHRKTTMVMECITGGELFERITGDDITLTEGDCINFMRQICKGVEHIHQNQILHLDLKPENIMCLDDTGYDIKIIDFGLAERFKEGDHLKILFGTPEFVAPEVVRYEDIGFGTDMWAVGVICYTLLSGLSPFMGESDTETLSNVTKGSWDFEDEAFNEVSDEAKNFIEKLLVFNKEGRMSAKQCLGHSWLASHEAVVDEVTAHKLSTERLKKFVARRRWQKTTHAVRAIGRMSILRLATQKRMSAPPSSLSLPIENQESDTSQENDKTVRTDIPENIANSEHKNRNRFSLPVLSMQHQYGAKYPSSVTTVTTPPSITEHCHDTDNKTPARHQHGQNATSIDRQKLFTGIGGIDTDRLATKGNNSDTDSSGAARGIDIPETNTDRSESYTSNTDTGICNTAEIRYNTAVDTVRHRDKKGIRQQKIQASVLALAENFDNGFQTSPSTCSTTNGQATNMQLGEGLSSRGTERVQGVPREEQHRANASIGVERESRTGEVKVEYSARDYEHLESNERVTEGNSIGGEGTTGSVAMSEIERPLKSILKKRPVSPGSNRQASSALNDVASKEFTSRQFNSPVNQQSRAIAGEEDLPNRSGGAIKPDPGLLEVNNSGVSRNDLYTAQSDPSEHSGSMPTELRNDGHNKHHPERDRNPSDESFVERKLCSRLSEPHSREDFDVVAISGTPDSTRWTSTNFESRSDITGSCKRGAESTISHVTDSESDSYPASGSFCSQSDREQVKQHPSFVQEKECREKVRHITEPSLDQRSKTKTSHCHQDGKPSASVIAQPSLPNSAAMESLAPQKRGPRSSSPYSRRFGRTKEDTNNNIDYACGGSEEAPVRAPVFLQKFHQIETCLLVDTEIKFESRIDGFPKPEVVWYKDSKRILEGHGRYQFQSGPNGWFTLIIPRAVESDQGSFMCEARNSAGKARCIAKLIFNQEDKRDIDYVYGSLSSKNSESGQRSGDVSSGNFFRSVSSAITSARKSRRSSSESKIEPPRNPEIDKKPRKTNRKTKKSLEKDNLYLRRLEELSSPDGSDVGADVRSDTCSKRSAVTAHSRVRRRSPSVERASRKFEKPDQGDTNPPSRKREVITMVRSGKSISSLTAKFENNSQTDAGSSGVHKPKTKLLRCESIGKSSLDSKRSRFTSHSERDLEQERTKNQRTSTGRIPVGPVPGTSSLVSRFQNQAGSDNKVPNKLQLSPFQKVADKASIIAKFESPTTNPPAKEMNLEPTSSTPKSVPTSPEPMSPDPISPEPVFTTDMDTLDFSPPYFVERPSDTSAVEHGSATLSCQVDGSPKPRVSWHFKGSSLKDGGRVRLNEKGGRHSLEIRELGAGDAGLYTCRVQNPSGRVSASVQIEVTDEPHVLQQGRPPMFLQKLSDVEVVKANQSARFECRVTGVPKPEVTWQIDNEPLLEGVRHRLEQHDDGLCVLEISDVTDDDDAFYTCQAKNEHGQARCSAELIVDIDEPDVPALSSGACVNGGLPKRNLDTSKTPTVKTKRKIETKAPAFVAQPQSLKVEPPKAAHFSCITRGKPEPEITWSKDGVLLVDGDRYNIHTEEGMSLLKIYSTSEEDVGSYACEAKNEVGSVEATFDVCMGGSPGIEDEPEFQITVSVASQSESAPPMNDKQHDDVTHDDGSKLSQLLSATTINPRFPPTFVEWPKCIATAKNSTARFVCMVQGEPKPSVSWTKDGRAIDGNERVDFGEDGEEVFLKIRGVRAEDEGEYTCTLVNAEGTASASANLIVKAVDSPPSFIEKPHGCTVKDGEKVVFSCKVKGQPIPEVRWLFRNQPLHSDGEVYVITQDHDVSTLTLPDVILDDDGEYVAVATNASGEERCSVKLCVQAPAPKPLRQEKKQSTHEAPSFTQTLKDVDAVDGAPLSLAVRVAGKPKPVMQWFLNGEPIQEDEDFKFVADGDRYSLVIAEVFPDDGGKYTCRIANDVGTAECSASVVVKEPIPEGTPPSFIQKPHSVSTDEGCSISLICEVAGDPPITVTWNKDGLPIKAGKRLKLETSGPDGLKRALHIPAVLATDAGSYQCLVENKFGSAKCTASLVVKELEEEQTDFRSLLKTRPRLQDMQNSPNSSSTEAEQLDFRHVLKRHVEPRNRPLISKYLHDQHVEEGNPAVFQCNITGNPEPKITWFHQAKEIKESKFFHMTYNENIARLEISEAFSEDEGDYVCKAVNSAGENRCTAKLRVKRTDSDNNGFSERRQSRTSSPMTNGRGSISSTTSEDPPNRKLSSTLNIVLSPPILKTETIPPVTIEIDARSIDSGIVPSYTNDITHMTESIYGMSKDRSSDVCFKFDGLEPSSTEGKAPEFLSELQDAHFVQGTDAELRCKVSGDPKPEFVWFKENVRIREGRKFKVKVSEEDVTLVVKDATESDAGKYRLIAQNSVGKAETSAKLVTSVPPTILEAPGPVSVIIGETASIECKFDGTPAPVVKWKKLRRRVQTSDRYLITTTDTSTALVIKNVNEMDAGRYTLIVQNDLGSDEANISLNVVGQPDPPVGKPVVSNVDCTALVLSWAASSYDGNSRITEYVIEARTSTDSKWREVGHTDLTCLKVTGLEPDTEYSFRVKAKNDYGTSDAGSATDVVRTDKLASVTNGLRSRPQRLPSGTGSVIRSSVTIKHDDSFSKHYELQDQVGKGRFGTVFSCLEKASGNKVAAKFIPVTPRKKTEVKEEIEIMEELDHPRLMRCFDAFEESKQVVMVLEYLSGGELFERIIDDDFSLTECDVIAYMRQICEGVRHMHDRRIIHLDLKPENIMCVNKTGRDIKLIDFGLAKRCSGEEDLKVLSGTPEFVAPEVINFDAVGFTTDMWSLGVVAYILLSGLSPSVGDDDTETTNNTSRLSGLSPFMGDEDTETLNNVTRGDWDFADESFDAISREAKDFISKLLVKKKEKRMSAKEAFDHRWLSHQQRYSSRGSQMKICTEKLKKFVTRRRWQKSANVVLAVNRLSSHPSKHEEQEEMDSVLKSQEDSCNDSVTLSNDKLGDTDNESMASSSSTTSAYSSGAMSTIRAESPEEISNKDKKSVHRSVKRADENENKIMTTTATQKPAFTKTIVDCIVFEGDCARFDCVITGDLEPDVTWYLDEEEIEEDERFFMEYDEDGRYSLIIRKTQEDDEGDYVVIAKNDAGQVSCAAELLVEPSANGF